MNRLSTLLFLSSSGCYKKFRYTYYSYKLLATTLVPLESRQKNTIKARNRSSNWQLCNGEFSRGSQSVGGIVVEQRTKAPGLHQLKYKLKSVRFFIHVDRLFFGARAAIFHPNDLVFVVHSISSLICLRKVETSLSQRKSSLSVSRLRRIYQRCF